MYDNMIQYRDFHWADVKHGYLETLGSLAETYKDSRSHKVTFDAHRRFYAQFGHQLPRAITLVAEHVPTGRIVGTATLLLEQKTIHEGGLVGHIEDVAVHKSWQGRHIGGTLIDQLVHRAKDERCYKVLLNCSEANTGFYERLGFRRHEISMRLDINPNEKKDEHG